ncbi:hypothetical protein KEM52_005838 [Ascosphaera acerosa]|nr:hypothetical protein KEM52_005838 [Ascosphaera acerosa]
MPPRASAATARRAAEKNADVTIIPKEIPLPKTSARLRSNVVELFADAQQSLAGHRKLVVRLRKIQEICCGLRSKAAATKADGGGNDADADGQQQRVQQRAQARQLREQYARADRLAEGEFNAEIARCLLRVLTVKRTEGAGDRVSKFLAAFLIHASEKDALIFTAAGDAGDADDDDATPETPVSRLTYALASTFIPLTAAKDRTVRFRTTQILTHIVGALTAIDDELYYAIRQALTRRIRDKEAAVRVQAVTGLTSLVGDAGDADSDTTALLERLLDILQNDASAEVRRVLLVGLPLSRRTLPYLLERARDVDTTTRKALYARLLPSLGDFRHLSLSMREKLLRWGVQDRDEAVRKAAGRIFYEHWIEDCVSSQQQQHEQEGADESSAPPTVSIPALVELLERIDVLNSGAENGVAHDAMRSFWDGRPDYRQAVAFDDAFWADLTPESAFLARSFNDFCRADPTGRFDDLVEEKLPEVTAVAIYLHRVVAELVAKTRADPKDGAVLELDFVAEQLLHICLTLDYSDEVGRRKMLMLLRETLASPELSEGLIRLVAEALRTVCGPGVKNEAEYCSVVLEAIAEVHDTIAASNAQADGRTGRSEGDDADMMDVDDDDDEEEEDQPSDAEDKPFNREAAKAKAIQEMVVNMKCLYIAQCMLQNIEGNLHSNDNLVTMLNTLIVPAVRSYEAPIRERGLECLGLCCLLDRNLAEENLALFVQCFQKGHKELQDMAVKILADILTVHTTILVPAPPAAESQEPELRPYHRPVLKVFARALRPGCPPPVQAAAVVALSKLLLTGTLSPTGKTVTETIRRMNETAVDQMLRALILAFFNPGTRDNLTLRQALTYFLPVYCHSRLENARHMCRLAVSMVGIILAAAEEYFSLEAEEDSDGEFVDEESGEKEVRALMANVIGMLVEWTDERRVVDAGHVAVVNGEARDRPPAWLHLSIARDIMERVLGAGDWADAAASKGERKYLLSMLGKLHVPAPPTVVTEEGEVRSVETGVRLATALKELFDEAIALNVAPDATSRNALVKGKNAVLRIMAGTQAGDAAKGSSGRGRRRGTTADAADDETVAGNETTLSTAATDATALEDRSTATIGQTRDGDGGGDGGGDGDGESTILAQGMEQMKV